MHSAERAAANLYAEAHRLGDELLRLLQEVASPDILDRVDQVIGGREAAIAEASRLNNGAVPTGTALDRLRELGQQQPVLERELQRWLARHREAYAKQRAAQQQVRDTQRLLHPTTRSRMVDQYR